LYGAIHVAQPSQGCLGFRVETEQGVLVYATDNEPGHPVFDKNVRKLAEGADILIYDSQYKPEEYEKGQKGMGPQHLARRCQHRDGKWRQGTHPLPPRPRPSRLLH